MVKKTGDIIQEYISNKISQVKLAELLEVSPQYLNNILNNKKSPSKNFLDKLYSIFKFSEQDIFLINEYEVFRKLPKNYQEEIINYRKSKIKDISVLLYKGDAIDNEINIFNEEIIINIINGNNIFDIKDNDFYIKISSDNYSDISKGSIIFFNNVDKEIKIEWNKIYLIEINNKYDLYYILEHSSKWTIIPLNKTKDIKIINGNKKKNLKIIGIASYKYSKFDWSRNEKVFWDRWN